MSIPIVDTSRGPTAFECDTTQDHRVVDKDFVRFNAKVFQPLQVGPFLLQHRIIHAALGRSRSANSVESPLAPKYFAQRTVPGTLVISQATGTSAESLPWAFSAGLWNEEQKEALRRIIESVHAKGGFWFHQLTSTGRCTSPSLVKRAWYLAGHDDEAPYGYQPVSSSNVAESGLNTHSGEPFGPPRPLHIHEIQILIADFKRTAQNAVDAGADGIEILSGNGFLLDQFLHDNINKRTDEYGGSVENRARLVLEIVDAVAEVVGYQRIGIRLSPFSNFHETDGSQPLEQIAYLAKELITRGLAYLNVGGPYSSRNLGIAANRDRLLAKGIALEDLSLRRFRLLAQELPAKPGFTPTRLFGNGGYTLDTTILEVEEDACDGVIHGKYFIGNPDLISRIRNGYPLTEPDRLTFYTHGAQGYITYPNYGETVPAPYDFLDDSAKNGSDKPQSNGLHDAHHTNTNGTNANGEPKLNGNHGSQKRPTVAIIGAGISGILSASALRRLDIFDIKIFERNSVPGGSWAYEEISQTVPQFPATDPYLLDPRHATPQGDLPLSVPRSAQRRHTSSPLYDSFHTNIPLPVMNGDTTFKLPQPDPEKAPYLTREQIVPSVAAHAHEYDDIITYKTTVEDVVKVPGNKLRLTLREEVSNDSDHWYQEEFDHLIVAAGHNSLPKIPDIKGLSAWKGEVHHSVTYRKPAEFKGKKLLIIGTSESAIDICIQSLPVVKSPIYISQRTPHPRYPTVFNRHGVITLPPIDHFAADSIAFEDGTSLGLDDVDTVVFATGYFYHYPFLENVRPKGDGLRIPGTYMHVFDIHNPESIAFVGLSNASLTWLTWEKSAFIIGLLWAGKIHLPPVEEQKRWEMTRLKETRPHHFHTLAKPAERVIYFDDLNELAGEYLGTEDADDELLRSFPFEWMVVLGQGGLAKKKFYGIVE